MQESLPSSYHRWSKRKKENYKKFLKEKAQKTKELKASNLQTWPLETLLRFKENLAVQQELKRRGHQSPLS